MPSKKAVDSEIERLEKRLAYLKAPALTQEEMIKEIVKNCEEDKPVKICKIIIKEKEQAHVKDPKFLKKLKERLAPLDYIAIPGTGGFFGDDRPAIWYFRSSCAHEFGIFKTDADDHQDED